MSEDPTRDEPVPATANEVDAIKSELSAAFRDLIASLESARDAIDRPERMPPPASARNLAEGYRYLMGFVHSAIEHAFHEDPARPTFRNALSILHRATIDNADAIYFYAPIDGHKQTLVRGRAADTRAWRGEARPARGPLAPHYVIFEASSGALAGDSGDLRELTPGARTQTGRLDSSAIEVEADGTFEILLAPERPVGHRGNFIATRRVVSKPHPFDADMPPERFATYVSGRQLFNDWEHEEAIHLAIHQVGAEGTAPPPYSPLQAAAELRRCGEIVRAQMNFWNAFWTIPMGTYGHRPGGIAGVEFPRNSFNRVNAASAATGGGMSTNLYAGGVFELEPDEALLIETRVPRPPQYLGFQLSNLFGESIEYAHATGSLNGSQCRAGQDGVIRIVVAHRDPGVPGWLDTTAHREGFMTARFAYSESPPPGEWPSLVARKVPLRDVRLHLPAGTGVVTPAERRAEIALREEHVQRRFRVF